MAKIYLVKCPVCGQTMSLEDEGFMEHVVAMMMVD